mmetsp:Transcript_26188/g.57473  ORF Transcript_26188/g.57473 Transcript_26188/m.57473 type:complete len:208 (-) Transcript_26188:674-1297(-)|eukprot:CAMPEP_0178562396 /NCGR_PEP_ID=MMETSP0697-20121206/12506_1 /TAXON_ID=265572 /ORGANISM="Extubocellulus spinifer, Strain CCMP396" /LENGTH=207 /DNA_ID=CAMNT_0020195733 /DNA_START=25 /DNA_END=648 /DNA_ORIENTATION=-
MTDDAYQAALRGGLSAAMPKKDTTSTSKSKIKAEKEKIVAQHAKEWLEGKSDEEKQELIQKAMAGGLASVAPKPKPKKVEKDGDEDPIPPAVRQWIEANKNKPKWENAAGETMTAAMYGGGIGSMIAKDKAQPARKKTSSKEEEKVPKSVQRWLESHPSKRDAIEYMSLSSWQYVPSDVKEFLDEEAKEHGAEEAAAALNKMVVNDE